MRMVLDSNVMVRATPASLGGPAWEVLQFAAREPHVLISSQPLLLELADVLRRPRVRRLHGFTDEEIARYVISVSHIAHVVPMPQTVPSVVPHDPQDDAVVHTAVLGKADVICTRDHHLLSVTVRSYCATHGIKVMDDLQLLRLLRSGARED